MSDADYAATLLTQDDERLQSVAIDTSTVVLSVYDELEVGTADGISADWSSKDPSAQLYLYAEGLALAGGLRVNGGVIAARSLTGAAAPAFDASGRAGDSPPAAPGGDPKPGGDGAAGGSLAFYLEAVDPAVAPPRLVARGGAGGNGQPGDATKNGGDGGNGGAGGEILALASHPANRWLAAAQAAHALTDLDAMQLAVKALASALPTGDAPAELPRLRALLAKALATKPLSIAVLTEALEAASFQLDLMRRNWKAALLSTLEVAGGAAGTHGAGASDGAQGAAGAAGTEAVSVVGAIDQVDPRDPAVVPVAAFVHPSQCAMLLAKAKLSFLFADPIARPETVADTVALFERVRARTEMFAALPDDSDLAKHYAANERALGAPNAVASLRATNAEAKLYLSYLQQGLDYFGYHSDYVPLTSLAAIEQDGLTPIMDAFAIVQQAYDDQFAQLASTQQTLAHVRAVRDQIQTMTADANVDIPQLAATMTSAASIIDGYKDVLDAKRKAATAAIEGYATKLAGWFNFDWSTLLGALGQCAFAPESGAMYAIQATTFAYAGSTSITDVQGQPVRKDFLVQQVRGVEATVQGLTEGYELLDDGQVQLDDPAAAKLLAAQDKMEALLDQLYGKFPDEAAAVRDAIKDYVTAVVTRNNQVMTYNAAITLYAQYAQAKDQAIASAAEVNDEALAALAADTPGLTSFVSQAYYRVRSQVLEFMNLAARAYRFWALTDEDLLRDALAGKSPPQINAAVLAQIQSNFWFTYTKDIGVHGGMQQFPNDPAAKRGETYVVTGAQLAVFKQTKQLFVTVPFTTKAATSGPFLGMSNVRVTHVRVYLHGAKTPSGTLQLNITHTGAEKIVNASDQVFQFKHAALSALFEYRLADEYIVVDATFQLETPDVPGTSPGLALVGPFTCWHIDASIGPNKDQLDVSDVTSIELDFRGYAQSFG